mgnify:CR=1 FL=1|tara:strand:+ start:1457 stop:1900 length:444 start_codon:yes stop_codon:yes gene_type:complete
MEETNDIVDNFYKKDISLEEMVEIMYGLSVEKDSDMISKFAEGEADNVHWYGVGGPDYDLDDEDEDERPDVMQHWRFGGRYIMKASINCEGYYTGWDIVREYYGGALCEEDLESSDGQTWYYFVVDRLRKKDKLYSYYKDRGIDWMV